MVLLLFKILRLEQKIVNQLSRRIINSLLSLECFICKKENRNNPILLINYFLKTNLAIASQRGVCGNISTF